MFAKHYDKLTSNIDYAKIADYVCDLVNLSYKGEGKILLDLACGTGSLSSQLALRGFDVIGVDASYDMLSEAMNKNYQNGQNVLYLCQTMQELDLYGTVDIAVCMLDSLNHIVDEKELLKAFEKVSLFLHPDGVFIFDINTEYKHRHILANNTFVYDMDEIYCVWQNNYNEKTHQTEISLDFFEQDGDVYYREEESFVERAYTLQQISNILDKSGFEITYMFDDYSKNKPSETSQRLVYVVKKKK